MTRPDTRGQSFDVLSLDKAKTKAKAATKRLTGITIFFHCQHSVDLKVHPKWTQPFDRKLKYHTQKIQNQLKAEELDSMEVCSPSA